MGAAHRSALECLDRPAGTFRTGTRGEVGIGRAHCRHGESRHRGLSFQIVAPRWGGVAHGRRYALDGMTSRAKLLSQKDMPCRRAIFATERRAEARRSVA